MPAQVFQLFPVSPDTLDGQVTVYCYGVMDGGNCGIPAFDCPDTVRKTLVVMDDVITMQLVPQIVVCAQTKGEHLRESHTGNRNPFQQVDGIG